MRMPGRHRLRPHPAGMAGAPTRPLHGELGALRGQALIEFVAVLLPVLLILVGIVQFGLLFSTNVTVTNAAREGTRAGTIYVYDRDHTRSWNDARRCTAVLTAAKNAFGLQSSTAPYFSVTTSGGICSTSTGESQANGDLVIAYCSHMATPSSACPNAIDPSTACTPDTREACLMRVSLTYRSDIVVPLIGPLLHLDSNGRFVQHVAVTMVIN